MSQDIYTHERDGQHVTFVDPVGVEHHALVTADWSTRTFEGPGAINVVYVTGDPEKKDPYGLQLERATSVPHQNNQSAHGYYWK